MEQDEFEVIALSEWQSVPQRFAALVKNVALLIGDEPSEEIRKEEGLEVGETLLGLYHGVPNTERGSEYGMGGALPDTITLFRLPILAEAEELTDDHTNQFREYVRQVVRETIWHEVGHYFGYDEHQVRGREDTRDNGKL